jgi:hypothetical protein
MTQPTIKTYKSGSSVPQHAFFALSHGINSGKPAREPWRNSFLIQCNSFEECEYWYWLCWGLHKSKRFERELTGSVIEFIRLSDFKKVLNNANSAVNKSKLQSIITTMRQIDEHNLLCESKMKLLKSAQISLFTTAFSHANKSQT